MDKSKEINHLICKLNSKDRTIALNYYHERDYDKLDELINSSITKLDNELYTLRKLQCIIAPYISDI